MRLKNQQLRANKSMKGGRNLDEKCSKLAEKLKKMPSSEIDVSYCFYRNFTEFAVR